MYFVFKKFLCRNVSYESKQMEYFIFYEQFREKKKCSNLDTSSGRE